MATLGAMGLISWASLRGEKKAKETGPPINATSKDEEAFIQYVSSHGLKHHFRIKVNAYGFHCREFIKNANAEEQKAKH